MLAFWLAFLAAAPLACAGEHRAPPRRSTEVPPTVKVTPAPSPPPTLSEEAVPDALARAYASGDEGLFRQVVAALDAGGAGDPDAREGRPQERTSEDGHRFAWLTKTGLYVGDTSSGVPQWYVPSLRDADLGEGFLGDGRWLVAQEPSFVPADGVRLDFPPEKQASFSIVDVAQRRVISTQRGVFVRATPSARLALVKDGPEKVLNVMDFAAGVLHRVRYTFPESHKTRAFDWTPTACSGGGQSCAAGDPEPWSLRWDNVSYSADESFVALNWQGLSREYARALGLTIHELGSGQMIASFATAAEALAAFSPTRPEMAILLDSGKVNSPSAEYDTLLMFDLRKRQTRIFTGCQMLHHRYGVLPLGFSPDGKRLLIDWDKESCIFDVATGRKVGELPRPQNNQPRFEFLQTKAHESPHFYHRTCTKKGYVLPIRFCQDAEDHPVPAP